MPLFNTANLFTFSFPSINRGAAWVTAFLDWTKRKQITINGAAKTADLTDTFTSDNSTDQDATNISVDATTNFRWDFDIKNDSTNDASSIDFGSTVSDSKFVIDFDFVLSTLTDASGTTANFVVLSSLDSATDSQTNQDALGMRIQNGVADAFGIVESDAQSLPAGASANMTTAVPTTRTYYVRFIRESTTKFTVILYADSDRSEVIDTISATINDTIASLRYFKISNYSGGGGGTATQIGYIDNLKIYDGVTTVENIPSQQTPTIDEDFTPVETWTDSGTKNTVSGGVLNWDFDIDGSHHATAYDNTTAFDDEKWTVQFDWTVDAVTDPSSGTDSGWFMMSSANETVNSSTVQDYIAMRLINNSSGIRDIRIGADNSTTIPDSVTPVDLGVNFSATTYYVTLRRLSSTLAQLDVYTDSNRTNLFATGTTTVDAGVTGLRYFKVMTSDNSGTDGALNGTIDNLKIWDGISEVNPTTLTDFVLPIKIQGDADLQRKTAETEEETGSFTSYTQTGSGIDVAKGTGVVDFNVSNSVVRDDCVWKDIGVLDNTNFVFDVDVDITSLTDNTNGASQELLIFLSSVNGTNTADSGSQDGLGFHFITNSSNSRIAALWGNNEQVRLNTTGGITFTQKTYYFRLVRGGDTNFNLVVYADSSRTIELDRINVKNMDASGVQSLRYLRIQEFNSSSANGTLIGTVSNVRVWDGITNPVTQETVTFEDDFTGVSPNWTDVGTGFAVNTSTDLIDCSFVEQDSDRIYHDLENELGVGGRLDPNYWIMRMKFRQLTHNTSMRGFIGISSTTGESTATQDFLGMGFLWSSTQDTLENFRIKNGTVASGQGVNTTWTNSTDYYLEFIKNGNNFTVNVYSDSSYSIRTLTNLQTTTSDFSDMRYIKIMAPNTSSTTTSTGEIDDVQIWNGISSPNASARKIVFTNDDTTNSAIQYPSKTLSYDPINGDYYGEVKIPTLTTGSNFNLYMYYNYNPSANPDYSPETIGTITRDETFDTTTGWTERDATECYIDTINNRIYYNGDLDVTDSTVYYDVVGQLGQAFNGKSLVLRCEPKKIANANLSHRVEFMLSAENVDMHTSQNSVGFAIGANNSFVGRTYQNSATPTDATAFTNTSNGTVEYVEIAIHGKLVTFRTFTDNTYSVLDQEFTLTLTDTMPDFNYIKLMDRSDTSSGSNTLEMEIKNLKIWDNISTFNREKSVHDANYKAVYHLQGNSLDSTVYGNDGTNTAVDWEQQNNSVGLVANGTTTKIDVSADTSINNVWVSGGEVEWTTNLKSDGEASGGRFFDKRGLGFGWTFIGEDEASGLIRIRLLIDFTTTNGQWETTNTVIPINEVVKLTVKYNGDSIENDPILIINGVKYTVGNGLTEVVKPAGSIRSDSSQAFTIANVTVQTTTIDGFMDNVKLSDKIRPSNQAIATYNAEKADSDILTLGSESTPLLSNVETNSVFIKTDTNKRFWYNGTTWVEQV